MNTFDGRIFFEKDSGTPSIQEILTTNSFPHAITGSLYLNGAVTASNFTGSFVGDGSGLTNVSADVAEVSTVTDTFTNVTTRTTTHNFETKNVIVSVYDDNDAQIIPSTVVTTNGNQVTVTFDSSTTGRVVVAKGGHVVSGSASDANNLDGQNGAYYLNYNNHTNTPTTISTSQANAITANTSKVGYTDALVKTKLNAETVISGSSQVDYDNIQNQPTTISSTQASNITTNNSKVGYTDALVKTKLNAETVISGSSQVDYDSIQNQPTTISSAQSTKLSNITITQAVDLDTLETNVSTNNSKVGYTDSLVKTKLNAETVISGSSQVDYDSIQNKLSVGDGGLTQNNFTNTLKSKLDGIEGGADVTDSGNVVPILNSNTVISGSSQVNHDATTNFVANEHIDHSSITIGSGKGLTGGGTIVASRSLTLNTGSNHFNNGIKSKLDSEEVISGSSSEVKSFLSLSSSDISDVDAFSQSGTYASLRAQSTTAGDVGLGNVTNESKSTMFTSPTFTGTPLSTTPSANDNSTKIATTAYVQTELTDLVGNAPAAFDTLGEISASLAADSGALDSLTTVVSGKLQKNQNLSDLTNVSTARTNLGVDVAGTDNSTDVTLAGNDYLTISGQEITANTIQNDDLANSSININGSDISLGGSVSTPNDNTQLSTEEVQDIVGGMLGGTETGISVTYQDGTGDIDFVVTSQTDNNFTNALKSKLDNIESLADVTDSGNVVPILNTQAVISGSTQVDYNAIQNKPTTISGTQASAITTNSSKVGYTDALVKIKLDAETVISGSSQVNYNSIQNQPTTISSAQTTKLGHISVTQAVNLDTMESNIATNNSKVGYTDSLVKTKLNAETVISGSSQITDLTTHKETVSGASSYAVDHNLGEQYPIVQCWSTHTSQQEFPESVTTNSSNRVTVEFSTTFAGIIIVKK
jgi:hypothetical protein